MPDEVSLGEVARGQERLERSMAGEVRRLEREHAADIARLEREHQEDLRMLREDVLKPLERRVEAQEQRPAMSFSKWMAALGVVAAFLAVVVAAWVASKGAK